MIPEEAVGLVVDVATTLTAQQALEIEITRYVNAAAFVILLYDHLLSLGSEINLIWTAKFTSAKAMFLFIRYMVPCALALYTVQLSGLSHIMLNDLFCRCWMGFAAFMGWTTVAISNFLILLRLWVIWDRNRKLVIYTSLCYLVAQIMGLVAAALLVWRMNISLYWNDLAGMCGFKEPQPPVAILWAPGTAFEVVLFGITWWNALTQPRSSNAPLAAAIYHDGFLYFLLLLCLRLTNTVLAAAAPPGLIFIAMFPVWCATTTTTCRLVIKLRQITEDQRLPDSAVTPSDDTHVMHGDYDQLVRSGVHIEMLRSVGPSTPMREPSGWY
ncbi:hypothetical protein B0H17DRAFT_1109392 [Mycena rosella]|uniref:DUF6533 domain-containing protein n=1 Tax=Mycena rosella TaxID=1033263 RepID=A0AAD7FKJ1_MYCRO|nr:hypothetical protein B0H17DRAFT_1109392 [Mycena rosella]